MIKSDVYAVGLLADIRKNRVRAGLGYVRYQLAKHNWRAIRNYFRNGWLTEHQGCPHNCGWGWTKRASARRVERAHRSLPEPGGSDS